MTQDFDNDVVTGNGTAPPGDQIEGATIATGDVDESIVGNDDTAVIDNEIDGAVAFGEGSDADSSGTTQIAGDQSTQLGSTHNSIDTEVREKSHRSRHPPDNEPTPARSHAIPGTRRQLG